MGTFLVSDLLFHTAVLAFTPSRPLLVSRWSDNLICLVLDPRSIVFRFQLHRFVVYGRYSHVWSLLWPIHFTVVFIHVLGIFHSFHYYFAVTGKLSHFVPSCLVPMHVSPCDWSCNVLSIRWCPLVRESCRSILPRRYAIYFILS